MSFLHGELLVGAIRQSRELVLMAAVFEGSLRTLISGRPHRRDASTLRILAVAPAYLPDRREPMDLTLHALLVELRSRGHEVQVITEHGAASTGVDGIHAHVAPDRAQTQQLVEWSDVVFAQQRSRQRAAYLAARSARPLACYVHAADSSSDTTVVGEPGLTLFSSSSLRDAYPVDGPSLVVHPIVAEREYRTTPGDRVTLFDLTERTGGKLFFELARRLPDHRFLGVTGWGRQVSADELPNTKLMAPQPDARKVYAHTRVLLVPSGSEAYGRVCMEAAASGIPTIAHPGTGVVEALGGAGLWSDRHDPDAWIGLLLLLDDPATYAEQSRRVRRRFEALTPAAEVGALEGALQHLVRGDVDPGDRRVTEAGRAHR